MAGRVVYDEPTRRGSLAAVVDEQIDCPPVVMISRHFEDIAHADSVTLQVDELRAILNAIEEATR